MDGWDGVGMCCVVVTRGNSYFCCVSANATFVSCSSDWGGAVGGELRLSWGDLFLDRDLHGDPLL